MQARQIELGKGLRDSLTRYPESGLEHVLTMIFSSHFTNKQDCKGEYWYVK